MSPDSLRNPFHISQLNQESPAHLMNTHLPPAEAQALTEALGEDEPSKSEPQQDLPPADISMSGKEQREVKNETFWSRQRYIEWAQEFGRNESWVDKTFEFQEDGTTIVEGDLLLRGTKIEQLPVGLMEVKGDLNISQNYSLKLNGYPKRVGGYLWCNESNLTSLQRMPEKVGRGIYLQNNKISSLDGLPDKVTGNLSLFNNQLENLDGISKEVSEDLSFTENNQLTSLEALRGIKIGGNLFLKDIPATEIPEEIQISGVISIREHQTTLAADARAKGYRVR